MADRTIFDEIVDGNAPSFKVWEDEKYLAVLSPFANTPGVTVVIPKKNPGDYIFGVDLTEAQGLVEAATKVAKRLEKAFGVDHVAMVFEGEAVPHVHAKLYPMHQAGADRSQFPKNEVFFPVYPGYITTVEGSRMSDEDLAAIQKKIVEASDED